MCKSKENVYMLARDFMLSAPTTSGGDKPAMCGEDDVHADSRADEEGIPGESSSSSSNLFVVFASNTSRVMQIFQQKAGDAERNHGVTYDYHVLLVQRRLASGKAGMNSRLQAGGDGRAQWESFVWDLDSMLEFPTRFRKYFRESFGHPPAGHAGGGADRDRYARLFRVVDAGMFLQYFASDRRHMVKRWPHQHREFAQATVAERDWHAPPPAWSPIRGEKADSSHNLFSVYLDMAGAVSLGPTDGDRDAFFSSVHTTPSGVVIDELSLSRAFDAEFGQ